MTAPNKKRGEARVELGDGVKILHYGNRALCLLEELMGGRSLLFQMRDPEALLSFNTVSKMVYAGLVGNKGRFSLEDVQEMMDPARLEHYLKACLSAIMEAMGKGKEMQEAQKDDPLARIAEPTPSQSETGIGTT